MNYSLISKDEHQKLRERFSPDGSLLRRQQLRMLELLTEVDRICKRHHIQYWLSSGTLIGAARHGGFIPWDDDLDIEMLLPDYERLMRVLPDELPPTMALQSTRTDRNYFFFYAKVRDRRSFLAEGNGYDRVWKERGIYIDIFPFYRQPLWIHRLSELAQGHVYKVMRRGGALWKVRLITRFNERFFFPLLRCACRFSKARETYGLGIPYHDPRYMEDILPLTEMEFEGRMFPVPNNTHRVLTLKYGDYMRLPDLDTLHPHVGELRIDNS
jgi:lipopolysaccharide cholinephosphotransferase